LNAWFLAALDGYMHGKYADVKGHLFESTPPVMVEIGPGSGANLRYLSPGTRLIAIEPNRRMQGMLRQRALKRGIELDLRESMGERLDIPSASVDFVFSSLVLCSVADPERVIAEVRRVLRAGGRFVCVEHVAAPNGSGNARLQRLIRSPWKWLFEGCDLCRDTGSMLRSSGFARVDIQPLLLDTIFVPVRHHIAAVCIN
jgi:SAM-dependent methyltransferase